MKIFEGMWANDLEDLLQPIVSVDEYESKIDSDAIAVGFFVSDRDAANDLNRFIQKSAVPIVDSDVSPAPDQRGYYLVFAELLKNDRFVANLMHLCEEVGQLGAVPNWRLKMRGVKGVHPLTAQHVKLGILRNSISDRLTSLQHELESIKTSR